MHTIQKGRAKAIGTNCTMLLKIKGLESRLLKRPRVAKYLTKLLGAGLGMSVQPMLRVNWQKKNLDGKPHVVLWICVSGLFKIPN